MSFTRIDNLLANEPPQGLGKIVRRARQMDELAARLRAALPASTADQLLAVNVREDNSLVLICGASSWAARLRFESERLIETAAAAGVRIERVRVRVATGLEQERPAQPCRSRDQA